MKEVLISKNCSWTEVECVLLVSFGFLEGYVETISYKH